MAITADRVKETTTTTGTGAYSLGGAVTGFRAFSSAFMTGDVVMYTVENGVDWEIGEGTLTNGSPWTLARTAILASSNAGSAVNWGAGAKNVFATLPASRYGREKLTAARTYYVRTDGSDSNNGLANTSDGAFATIQKAVDVVCGTLDMGVYQVTIQVGSGTYTGAVLLNSYFGSLAPILLGDTAAPSNVTISTTSGNCITLANKSEWVIKGFKLTTTTSGSCLVVSYGGRLTHYEMDFGICAGVHISATVNGVVTCAANYTISGSAQIHWSVADAGITNGSSGKTITLTGSPAFSIAFLYMRTTGVSVPSSNTVFSGSATGIRYNIATNAACFVNGASTSYLPGNAAGTTAAGGQYA